MTDLAAPAPERTCPACQGRFPAGANYCPHDGQGLEDIADAPAIYDPLIDTVIDGRYRLVARLGQGGMGVVYAARHAVIDKQVAVKVLREEYCRDPGMVERFMREARAASHIGHPNIVDVTDFGRTPDGQVYFVMEFLVGTTLSKELRACGALPTWRAVSITQQICQGLTNAHSKGIVHRDLKPENVFIVNPVRARPGAPEPAGARCDFVKLLDFGIAKFTYGPGARLTQAGSIFGTPQYMSPEQAGGHDGDHRGDIYALGCMLYEMVTGTVPFLAETFMGTLSKHIFELPEPPRGRRPDLQLPEELEAAILRAMAKSPDARFQSMAAMGAALAACDVAAPVPAAAGAAAPMAAPATGDGSPAAAAPPTATAAPAAATAPQDPEADDVQPAAAAPAPTVRPRSAPPTEDVRLLGARRAARWRIAGVAALAAVLVAGAYLAFRRTPAGGTSIADAAPAPTRAPDAAIRAGADRGPLRPEDAATGDAARRDADRALAAEGVALRLTSVPPGAEVWMARKALGTTPLTLRLPRGQAMSFTFRKRGYRRLAHALTVGDRDQELVVTLVPRGASRPDNRPKIEDLRRPPWR